MLRFATTLGSLALATLVSAPALAQGVGVGVAIPGVQVGGQINLGVPQVVVPAPQPVVVAPPPQQVVVVPQSQPVVVYAPVPQRPVYYYRAPAEPFWGASRLGLDLRVDGAAGFNAKNGGNTYGMGGAGLGLRYRAVPHFGFEIGADFLGGRDWNGLKAWDIAGHLGGNLYFNPRSRAQVYLSGGLLADREQTDKGQAPCFGTGCTAIVKNFAYTHVGGYGGLGLEVFVTPHLSLHGDARAFVRQAVAGDTPEFTDVTTGRTTNTSAGIMGSGGLVLYF